MNLQQRFQQHWNEHFCSLNCRLLLAVSGGVDSVVLTDLLASSGIDFAIAHVNFQLREEESEQDEQFVRELANRYSKELFVQKFDTAAYANQNKMAVQEAARVLRYNWFDQIVTEWGRSNSYIVTAHHADDNIETVLINFFRGTGITGLTGIQPIKEDKRLIRPLLAFRKKELTAYAKEKQLSYREDSSNSSDKYTRNFFRNKLLPSIKEVFPNAEENLLNNIDRFNDIASVYKKSVDATIKDMIETKAAEIHVPVLKWKKAAPLQTITWELISRYGFSAAQTSEVIKLLDAGNGAYCSSSTHRIIRNRKWMIISPVAAIDMAHILIEKEDQHIDFTGGSLQLSFQENKNITPSADPAEAFLDADQFGFPLLMRKWKTGDYFYPLGMQKKKKLSRFFIDRKLSKTDKENCWVLESEGKIIWVIGQRIDNRLRITEKTKTLFHIIYRK